MEELHPVQCRLLRFHIDHLRDMRIKSRRLAEASHRTDITEVRLIRSAREIPPHPQDCIRWTDDERSLLHRPREIVHRYLVTDDRHLPVRMTRIHEFPKFSSRCSSSFAGTGRIASVRTDACSKIAILAPLCLTNPHLMNLLRL